MRWRLPLVCGMRGTGRAVVSGSRSRWRPLPLLRGGLPALLIGVVMDDAGARRRLFGVSGLFPLSVRPFFPSITGGSCCFFLRWDNVLSLTGLKWASNGRTVEYRTEFY